ncbi:uncharacterized protein EV420DRAFT_1279737 [Desarmillaria tabescens]|uniref:Uncharacterized protein n=1 Tax=Armillaria tabescens TaxID=1929756 RepID=A0AA39JAB1_ARMTA|nr:uncharacterized protein EV420DRAFT_1279737 [Desarmillaria tabescens]KAK0439090.1 hypothetical protein EV420DRAFT_1279737 [Desarmillaria tabescens]
MEKYEEEGHRPSSRTLNLIRETAEPIYTSLTTEGLPTAKGAYSAVNFAGPDASKQYSADDLRALGFSEVPWEGFDPRPIVDCKGRIVAVIAGQPRDPSYSAACMEVHDDILREGQTANFRKNCHGRRGGFPAVNVGISYGKGQKVPSRLQNGVLAGIINRLVGSEAVRRMASYASASYNLWAPRLHRHYEEHLSVLYEKLPHLRPNFPRSIFPCATFNFGGNVWTFKHRDIMNCPYGWCAITALGRFDHRRGAHLILWELKLFIQFPHGATVFIPSATITHSNTPPAEGDSRTSFTQFLAGGILRWVDNGFRTEKEMARQDPAAHAEMQKRKATRWEMGLGLLSTLDEILEPIAP